MIAVIYGTTGELIKLAPVMRRLDSSGVPLVGICTGQQAEQIAPMLSDFGLPAPTLWLGRGSGGRDLEHPRQLPPWFATVCMRFVRFRRELLRRMRGSNQSPLVMVHGDTMTTLIGAALGRLLFMPVAHVEAGLRTGDWRDPFPEELHRRGVAKLARIHFAPGAGAVRNLHSERARGEIVDTGHNTIVDNLREIPPGIPPGIDVPNEPFGLVSFHRQELLYRRKALAEIVASLRQAASRTRLLFIDHPITAAAIESGGLATMFDSDRFIRIPRQRYLHFLSLLKASSFLVTDSGGSQEECAFLGHPCLVHRAVSERHEGLDGSVVLSGMNFRTVESFLQDPERHRRHASVPVESPSDRILDFLAERGFLALSGRAQLTADGLV